MSEQEALWKRIADGLVPPPARPPADPLVVAKTVVPGDHKKKFRCRRGHEFELDTVYANPACPLCREPASPA